MIIILHSVYVFKKLIINLKRLFYKCIVELYEIND